MNDSLSEKSMAGDLGELSRKTGLIIRPLDSAALDALFARLEEYDADERTETLEHLKCALDETRTSLGAEAVFERRRPDGEPGGALPHYGLKPT
jgi:hypothetical protein